MLGRRLLALPRRGALNMHGSLLPKYRGRAPVNWAVITGESETGASLHYMTEKPDAGAIVGRQAVPILPDDTAREVFDKVTLAAELVLDARAARAARRARAAARRRTSPPAATSAAGARRTAASTGPGARARSTTWCARVAPPYPGAFASIGGVPLRILRTRVEPACADASPVPALYCEGARCYADCASGGRLRLLEFEVDGRAAGAAEAEGPFWFATRNFRLTKIP